jgi:hypothetical protein
MSVDKMNGIARNRKNRSMKIKHRLSILKINNRCFPKPIGMLDKYNLVCSCELCSENAKRKNEKKITRLLAKKEILSEMMEL